MRKHLVVLGWWLFLECFSMRAQAQLSPPGLGPAHTASWFATGIRQDLDAAQRWESMTYAGFGATSQPDDYNPLQRPALFVLNQEFYDQYAKSWLYSFAVSYRRQNEYEGTSPYGAADPSFKHELRFYGRYSHALSISRFKLVSTLRPELRTFYSPDLGAQEFLQFRARFRSQGKWQLDEKGVHRIIASAEVLASIGKTHTHSGWTDFGYRETRFCLYYSLSVPSWPFVIDIGYMNDLLGTARPLTDVHYLAFDITWDNPFGTPKHRENQKPAGYLE